MKKTALLVLVPFLTFASALAPQHVHEPEHDDDHAVAHSHFDPHRVDAHHSHGTEIEHGSDLVVWLDSPILHESSHQAAPIPPAVPVSYDIVPAEMHWSVTAFDDAAPVHGPPKRAHLLRGPPLPRLS